MGFVLAAAGYRWLGMSGSLSMAALAVVLAHSGSSSNWVFSTTLLQIYTDLCMLGISVSSYLASVAIDLWFPVRKLAIGVLMLLPSAAWVEALRAANGKFRTI